MACDSSIVVRFIMLTALIFPLHAVNETQNVPDVEDKNVSLRIVNGFLIKIIDVPYVVSLQDATLHPQLKYVCGGALLSRVWVMTAGHCLIDKSPWNTLVRAGSRYCDSGGILIPVDRFYVHPFYVESVRYDFGLVKMKKWKFRDSAKLGTVELPNLYDTFPIGTMFLVCGWGETLEGDLASPCALRAVHLPKISNWDCNDVPDFKGDIPPEHFCAGYLDRKMGSCYGDSGGPLTVNNILVGIVSGGTIHCDSVTVFSKVSAVRSWISFYTGL